MKIERKKMLLAAGVLALAGCSSSHQASTEKSSFLAGMFNCPPKHIGAAGPTGEVGVAYVPCEDFVGPCGPQGPAGPQGPMGPAGPCGPSGKCVTGIVGPCGPQGPLGPDGPAGPRGPAGLIVRGPAGPMGPAGPNGPQGLAGSAGDQGASAEGIVGPAGPAGPQGPQGPAGSIGERGPTLVGPAGPAGPAGYAGKSGDNGPAGRRGDTTAGLVGPRGAAGPGGERGKGGPAGSIGRLGAVDCWVVYRTFWFEGTKCEIRSSDSSLTMEIAAHLKQNPSLQVGIDGEKSRANAVRNALIEDGISADRIHIGSYGDPKLRTERRVAILLKTGSE